MNKLELIEMIKKMDGVAAVNLAEPSEGDLERVVAAYAETRAENDRLKAEITELRKRLIELSRSGAV